MAIFTGAGVAIVTPMKDNYEVNYEKLDEILEDQIAGGTDCIVICGTTGESATLTEEEHLETIRFTIDKVNHRIPVIAGTGSNSTATAVQMSEEAAQVGADGILLVTPYYNKATQKGLIGHYTTVANAAKVPAVLYNVPSRTGCSMSADTIAHLVKNVEYIVGVKEASGNISHVAETIEKCDGKIDIYSGNDDQIRTDPVSGRKRCDFRTFQYRSPGNARHCRTVYEWKDRGKPQTSVESPAAGESIVQ